MLRAELLKLRTVSSTWIAVTVGVLGLLLTQVLFTTLVPAISDSRIFAEGAGLGSMLGVIDVASAGFQYSALDVLGGGGQTGSVGIAAIVALALGLLVGTTDYRHGGILGAALAQPRRGGILLAKAGATVVAAAALGVAFALVSLAVLLVSVVSSGSDLAVTVVGAGSVVGRGVVVIVLLALLGLGIGVLVRSQIVAAIVVGALLLGEPVLQGLVQLVSGTLPTWAQVLPMTLARAGTTGAGDIPPLVALLMLSGIALAVLGAATVALRRRDL